jgi:hypothetical protein
MPLIGVNIKQNKQITLLFTILGVITISLGAFVYYQKLKHDKERREIEGLDREIKRLQLFELQNKQAGK